MKSQSPCWVQLYYLLRLYLSFSSLLPSLSLHLFISLNPLKFKAREVESLHDSNPNRSFSSHKPLVLNSFPKDNNNNNLNNWRGQHKWKHPNMDATITRNRFPSSPPNNTTTSTISSQVNLTSDDKKAHIDEMHFFGIEKKN